ncbi:MAG: hypothetical protein RLZZ210_222 [Pseudomonadota bacterium]|jgi:muramoyltetrapeptide carboxypeptidase
MKSDNTDNTNYKYNLNLIAPSGYSPIHKVEQSSKIWKMLGHSVDDNQVSYINNRAKLRFGGSDEERENDLYFTINPNIQNSNSINIAMPVRGGYGLSRIIEKANWYKIADLINNHNIYVVGHSDFTLFHLCLYKFTNTISYAGAMFTSDFSVDSLENLDKFMLDSLNKSVHKQCISYNINPHILNTAHNTNNYIIEGILWGGNLTMLCTIIGSDYMPKIDGGILFVEDINEHPYRVERLLHQLYHANILTRQSALVFGNFSDYKTTDYDNGYDLNNVIDYWQAKLSPHNVQVFTNLAFGHCKTKATLPIGQVCKIQNNQLMINY